VLVLVQAQVAPAVKVEVPAPERVPEAREEKGEAQEQELAAPAA
jgi:hypothetical protein